MVCLALGLNKDGVLLKFLRGRHGGNRKTFEKRCQASDVSIYTLLTRVYFFAFLSHSINARLQICTGILLLRLLLLAIPSNHILGTSCFSTPLCSYYTNPSFALSSSFLPRSHLCTCFLFYNVCFFSIYIYLNSANFNIVSPNPPFLSGKLPS